MTDADCFRYHIPGLTEDIAHIVHEYVTPEWLLLIADHLYKYIPFDGKNALVGWGYSADSDDLCQQIYDTWLTCKNIESDGEIEYWTTGLGPVPGHMKELREYVRKGVMNKHDLKKFVPECILPDPKTGFCYVRRYVPHVFCAPDAVEYGNLRDMLWNSDMLCGELDRERNDLLMRHCENKDDIPDILKRKIYGIYLHLHLLIVLQYLEMKEL